MITKQKIANEILELLDKHSLLDEKSLRKLHLNNYKVSQMRQGQISKIHEDFLMKVLLSIKNLIDNK